MVILSKLIYRLSTITIRIPGSFFTEIGKLILKIIWKFTGPKRVKTIKTKLEDSHFPILKLTTKRDSPGGTVVKNLPTNAGDTGSSPGPGRSHMLRSN